MNNRKLTNSSTSRLIVGRASAGSGKTFNLTLEYIRLLVENPMNYRHILAVTFTNKATAELKARIIDTLYGIASGASDTDAYLSHLITATVSADTVRQNAAQALSAILHDYSYFRIETIDSFFQSIIRDLARELNLTANLRIDIESDDALADAVGMMIENMRQGDPTYTAVINYISEKMNSEHPSNWKIDRELTDFCRNIFNEHYLKAEKEIRRLTSNPKFYPEYKQRLNQEKRTAETERTKLAQSFMKRISDYGLDPSQFVGGKTGIYAYFPKVAEGKTPKELPKAFRDNPMCQWMKNNALDATHAPFMRQLMMREQQLLATIATTSAILRHAGRMELLSKVDDTLRQANEEHNRFILADTAHRLNEIISDADVPFIMEKAATQFRYIMIDEFQDTSTLQWQNFMPLIKECIASGNRCFVVGDVKQSIYRWRGSDWNILNHIGTEAPHIGQIDESTMTNTLDTNRRSDQTIVEFNNSFFHQAAADVSMRIDAETSQPRGTTTDILTAYADVEQKFLAKKQKHGFVSIVDLSPEYETMKNNAGKQADPMMQTQADPMMQTQADPMMQTQADPMMEAVTSNIMRLHQEQGVAYNEMAILCRHNKELQHITAHLKACIPDIEIVSSETFRLDASPAVAIIITALRALSATNKPMTRYHLGTLAYKYHTDVLGEVPQHINSFFTSPPEELAQLLPAEFMERTDTLQSMPLYELCERLHDIFQLSRIDGQSSYLFCFFDQLRKFIHDKAPDTDRFLNFWDEKLGSKTIPADGASGIQMLTIHKSKGLEFHTVIIPYCNWNMDGLASVIWCPPTDATLQLPVIPLTFSKELASTAFKPCYNEEKLKNYVDNLNLLYVGFTRASHNLVVLTTRPEKGYTTYSVIHDALLHLYPDTFANPDDISIDIGSAEQGQPTSQEPQGCIGVEFSTGGIKAEFKQSNASRDFTIDPDSPAAERNSYIRRGLIVHKVFELIHTAADIHPVLNNLEQQGVIGSAQMRAEIETDIRRAMNNAQVARWFAPEWEVMNECSIVVNDVNGSITTRRPDRVITNGTETIVVDYKTGHPQSGHIKQVMQYVDLLRQMRMPDVSGYIWYIATGEVVDVVNSVKTKPVNDASAY